jgi:uncharacterized surface protein with fasciclin (FAS1) repeats
MVEPFEGLPDSGATVEGTDDSTVTPNQRSVMLETTALLLVGATVLDAEVKTGSARTVQGANVALSRASWFVTVEDVVVAQADVKASNGVVHVIDRLLIAPKR